MEEKESTPTPSTLEPERPLTKQEKRLLKKKQKAAAQKARRRRQRIKKTALFIIGLLILAGLGWAAVRALINYAPTSPDLSIEFADQGRAHIQPGQAHPPYNSNPPTSGWHYPDPARTGIYDRELPDEELVHNLEHGDIWIAYRPTLSAEAVRQLKNLVSTKVLLEPRAANDTDIAAAAWGRLDKFDLEHDRLTDEQLTRLKDFIKRYRNQGPESRPAGNHP